MPELSILMEIPALKESGWRLQESARGWLRSVAETFPGEIAFAEIPEMVEGMVATRSPVVVFAAPGQVATAESAEARVVYKTAFAAERGDGLATEYVALAAAGTSLGDHLGGLMLYDVSDGGSIVPMAWIERTASSGDGGIAISTADASIPRFRVGHTDRPARAILPVFFGTADVAVAARSDLDAIAKLNPQVMEVLDTIEASPPLLGGTIFVRGDLDRGREKAVNEVLGNLGRTDEGRRLLRGLGWRAVRPFNPEISGMYQTTLSAMGIGDGDDPEAAERPPLADAGREDSPGGEEP